MKIPLPLIRAWKKNGDRFNWPGYSVWNPAGFYVKSKPSQRQSLLSSYHSVRLIFPAFQLQFDRQTVHLFLLQAAHHVSGFGKCRQWYPLLLVEESTWWSRVLRVKNWLSIYSISLVKVVKHFLLAKKSFQVDWFLFVFVCLFVCFFFQKSNNRQRLLTCCDVTGCY